MRDIVIETICGLSKQVVRWKSQLASKCENVLNIDGPSDTLKQFEFLYFIGVRYTHFAWIRVKSCVK